MPHTHTCSHLRAPSASQLPTRTMNVCSTGAVLVRCQPSSHALTTARSPTSLARTPSHTTHTHTRPSRRTPLPVPISSRALDSSQLLKSNPTRPRPGSRAHSPFESPAQGRSRQRSRAGHRPTLPPLGRRRPHKRPRLHHSRPHHSPEAPPAPQPTTPRFSCRGVS